MTIRFGVQIGGRIFVYLDDRCVGTIKHRSDGKFQYYSKGSKAKGEPFDTVAACKRSLESPASSDDLTRQEP
jgi:hypothetical protein